jgi:hypothetical protein
MRRETIQSAGRRLMNEGLETGKALSMLDVKWSRISVALKGYFNVSSAYIAKKLRLKRKEHIDPSTSVCLSQWDNATEDIGAATMLQWLV